MFGIGEFSIGGFPSEDSVSIADPLLGILSDPNDREFLFRAIPKGISHIVTDLNESIITDDSDFVVTDYQDVQVDLSSSGYTSKVDDDPYKLFPSAISRPYNFSVDLPLPSLSGGASLGSGEIKFKNSDGDFDGIAQLDWLGVDISSYIGRKQGSLTSFTRFSRGRSAGVSWDLENVSILHKDLRFRLQRRLQQKRYFGTGSCLRFDGSGDFVSYGDILDQGSGDSFTVEILFRSSNTGSERVIFGKKANLTTGAGWVAYYTSGNDLVFRIADGTNSESISIAGVGYLDGGRLRRLSCVVDRAENEEHLYLDGELISTVDISAVGSLTNAIPLQAGANDSLMSWLGDCDDFRFWSYARTQDQIKSSMHKEILPQTGLELYSKYNEGALTSAGDSSGNGHTGTITGATWVGSLEGDTSLAGTVIPIALGIKRMISPKLVDPLKFVYQAHDGSMEAIDDVMDGGDSYTFGSDVSDIYASTPAAGSYNTCLAKGLFRLGSSPVGVITCRVRGDNTAPLGYTDTLSGVHQKVATLYGGLSSDDDLNLNTYLLLTAKTAAKVGFYFDSEINTDAALDLIAKDGGSAWWSPDRVAKISVGRIDPPESLSPEVEITSRDIISPRKGGQYRRSSVGNRIGQVVLGYRHYDTTLSENQVAGTVDLTTRNDLGQQYRFVEATDHNRSEDADVLAVFTNIDEQEDAQAEADRLLALWKVDRATYHISLGSGILSYFIGTPFRVTVDRYDTRYGKRFVAIGLSEDMGEYGSKDKLEPVLFG